MFIRVKRYKLKHNGKIYEPGEIIEMEDEHGKKLVEGDSKLFEEIVKAEKQDAATVDASSDTGSDTGNQTEEKLTKEGKNAKTTSKDNEKDALPAI